MARVANCHELRRPFFVPSGLPAYVTDDIESCHNSLVLLRVADENSRGRLEELHDLIDIFVRARPWETAARAELQR